MRSIGVRLNVEIKREDNSVTTAALASTGYESDEAEIHLPLALARRLGFKLEGLRSERYFVVGSEVSTFVLGMVEVRVVTQDRTTEWVKSRAVTVPGEYEVLLSDALIELLNVEIVRPRSRIWRFRGEDKDRESVEPEYWLD